MANPSATLAITSAIHTHGGHSISHQATTSANKTKLHNSGKNISHRAITSANHIHGNTISHSGSNICHKKNSNNNNNSGTPFGATDDQSGNTNSH